MQMPTSVPRIDMSPLDDLKLDFLLRGIHKALVNCDYKKVHDDIYGTLILLIKYGGVCLDKSMFNAAIEQFYKMRVDVKLGRYESVHNRVRDLHSKMISLYLSDSDDDSLESVVIMNSLDKAYYKFDANGERYKMF